MDLEQTNTVGESAEKIQLHVFACHERIHELKAELASARLICEDWIKIANSGANKLNEAVRNADAWAKSANDADDRLKVEIRRSDDNHRQLMAVAESGRTWQATADAHLVTLKEQRAVMGELYSMAIEHCKDRGWFKHPTIDKAHAILWPNRPSEQPAI